MADKRLSVLFRVKWHFVYRFHNSFFSFVYRFERLIKSCTDDCNILPGSIRNIFNPNDSHTHPCHSHSFSISSPPYHACVYGHSLLSAPPFCFPGLLLALFCFFSTSSASSCAMLRSIWAPLEGWFPCIVACC